MIAHTIESAGASSAVERVIVLLRIEGDKIEVKTGNGSVWLVDHEIKDLALIGRFS